MSAMSAIFEAAGEEVWWADREGGVCGRPLKLAGETDSARKMMKYNADLFKHGITTLVTSCPICLKVFREDYDLPGIEILHHSEYILTVRAAFRWSTLHPNPCELARQRTRAACGDRTWANCSNPPRRARTPSAAALSVANTAISDGQQVQNRPVGRRAAGGPR